MRHRETRAARKGGVEELARAARAEINYIRAAAEPIQ